MPAHLSPSRTLARVALLTFAAIGAAHAEQHGLVVRLVADNEPITGAVSVELGGPAGGPSVVTLKDDGVPPDVTAGDNAYSGSTWLDGDDFTVTVHVGDKTIDGGKVSWQPTDTARDLAVGLKGGTVAVEAGVSAAAGGGASGPPSDPGAADGGPGASAPGSPPGSAPGSAPTGIPVAPRSSLGGGADSSLYIGFGVGLLVLVGIGWLWLRNQAADGPARPNGLLPVPEPGLLGDGTPSLSDGLMVWIASPEDAEARVRPLAATLARHHRVLFVGPAGATAPSVYGGPVFRTANARPSHVGDVAEALQAEGGAPVAVLVTGAAPDAGVHKDYADLLPTGVGGVSIVGADPGVTAVGRVNVRREGAVWVLQSGERTLRMVESPAGLVDEPRSSAA